MGFKTTVTPPSTGIKSEPTINDQITIQKWLNGNLTLSFLKRVSLEIMWNIPLGLKHHSPTIFSHQLWVWRRCATVGSGSKWATLIFTLQQASLSVSYTHL